VPASTTQVYNARLLLDSNSKEKRMKGIVTALAGILLLLGLGGQVVAPVTARAQEEAVAKTNLKVGETAPDFSLLSDKWEQVKLSDYRGKKNVILAFYVLAFTGG
jgi:AhpC/TSA family